MVHIMHDHITPPSIMIRACLHVNHGRDIERSFPGTSQQDIFSSAMPIFPCRNGLPSPRPPSLPFPSLPFRRSLTLIALVAEPRGLFRSFHRRGARRRLRGRVRGRRRGRQEGHRDRQRDGGLISFVVSASMCFACRLQRRPAAVRSQSCFAQSVH